MVNAWTVYTQLPVKGGATIGSSDRRNPWLGSRYSDAIQMFGRPNVDLSL